MDELSTADKSQFRKSSLLDVALRSRRSLRFKFRGQAVGTGFRVCPVAVVFWPGLPGLCAVPTLLQADRGALVFLNSEVLSRSYFGELEVWCGHALGGLS